MIEIELNTKYESPVNTTLDLNVPSKGTLTSIVDSEAFRPAGLGAPLLPAEK